MSEHSADPATAAPDDIGAPEHAEVVGRSDGSTGQALEGSSESVSSPAKVMRIGSMIKQLLDEVRAASLDEPGRDRLKLIYEQSITELSESMSPDLREELAAMVPPFASSTPSEAELRVAQAQLVGWLEGLFHGIQATLFAQQMAARQQLEQIRGQLPPGQQPAPDSAEMRPGTYL
jgi:Protein of unknown function (DUF2587)